VKAAFLVRRARLLLGETQEEFAERFDVAISTVSRWERGRLHPAPKDYARIRAIEVADPNSARDLIRASRVYKFLADISDLRHPMVISRGLADGVAEATGYTPEELGQTADLLLHSTYGPGSTHWNISTTHGLEVIEKTPCWQRGEIAYAEMHAYSLRLKTWLYSLIAPIADLDFALVESVADPKPDRRFWIKYEPIHQEGD
jgi:transcriptional regulator with XRE-family HTH domain